MKRSRARASRGDGDGNKSGRQKRGQGRQSIGDGNKGGKQAKVALTATAMTKREMATYFHDTSLPSTVAAIAADAATAIAATTKHCL
jgi:hypothetical protein